jgi:hypothetical protein
VCVILLVLIQNVTTKHSDNTQHFMKSKELHVIEKNEMGGACGAYGKGERCSQVSGGET